MRKHGPGEEPRSLEGPRIPRGFRWDLVLPGVAVGVAVALLALAATAAGALRERQLLVIEGRLLQLAHGLEHELRQDGPEASEGALEGVFERESDLVAGLRLRDLDGSLEAAVGAGPEPAAGPGARRVDLFLGPAWHRGAPGPRAPGRPRGLGGGRRTLEIDLRPEALTPPTIARLLVPASAVVAAVLMVLAVLGGRLLIRRQEEERRAAERKRLESLARAGAGLAHQLRNPLATLKGSCQLLLEDVSEGAGEDAQSGAPLRKRLRAMLEQSERMDRLLSELLDFARPPSPEPQSVDLAAAVHEATVEASRTELDVSPGLCVWADPEHLAHILGNLLANAFAFSPHAAVVTVRARPTDGRVRVQVIDRGPGPGDDPELLFEPYVTSRPDGAGLGLTLARALAEANGGTVFLDAGPAGGAVAVLELPRAGDGGVA